VAASRKVQGKGRIGWVVLADVGRWVLQSRDTECQRRGKKRDNGGVRLRFWQGESLGDVADEALPLALRPRGPAGRLACKGTQRGSARGGAWPGGPAAKPQRRP
jgi:hypothetical protein